MKPMELGKWGEEKAKEYLECRGYTILAQNYKCPIGEIDLICQHENFIIFVEVKTRRSMSFGLPAEAVGRKKQYKYTMVALYYIKHNNQYNKSYRFDIIEVRQDSQKGCMINHIDNAFQAVGVWSGI